MNGEKKNPSSKKLLAHISELSKKKKSDYTKEKDWHCVKQIEPLHAISGPMWNALLLM